MEFTLSDPPAHGYEPGDTLSGEVRYNITAQQETILDGSVLVHPSKLKYEAHRSNITLVGESNTIPRTIHAKAAAASLALFFCTTRNYFGQGCLGTSTSIDGPPIPRRYTDPG
jgi:hypothetical protein